MRRIAIYGKGGIGKSTTTSNITEALTEKGLTVMQVGCDPKADSTRMLTSGKKIPTVLELIRNDPDTQLDEMVFEGHNGALCVECGGPRPGMGCAGRGIIAAFETLEKLNVVSKYNPDVMIYDVLGDVVCGGFAMPIRNGYARDVFIVTSGEMMSLYAANNIAEAISEFADEGYARLKGLIQNSRNVDNEDELVSLASKEIGTEILYRIKRDPTVQICENAGTTVVAGAPDSEQAASYRTLADLILEKSENIAGNLKMI